MLQLCKVWRAGNTPVLELNNHLAAADVAAPGCAGVQDVPCLEYISGFAVTTQASTRDNIRAGSCR